MRIASKKEPLILLAGDLLFFVVSLWLSLYLRTLSLPSRSLFYTHLAPFAILFAVWIVVFYIAGLYGKHTLILLSRLPSTLLNTLLANSILAISFFYFIPFFGITPKTILFIYLAVSFVAMLLWRMKLCFFLTRRVGERALIIGTGPEAEELRREMERNDIYNISLVDDIADASLIIADLSDDRAAELLPELYIRIFSGASFIEIHSLYEDIFDRVPLSFLGYEWFLRNVSTTPKTGYDALKRLMDILIAVPLLVVPIVVYPFAALAMKIEDGGPTFISQERIGRHGKKIKVYKFRSMSRNDQGEYGAKGTTDLRVTSVGNFLRRTRLDEFPQLWNVLKGDISLIGPRPELPSLVFVYTKEIPYYNVRHIIKPGLSGWAQIHQENHPHHREAVMETREKLAYDLYYIKERSVFLDLKIALQTIKTLLSRAGI